VHLFGGPARRPFIPVNCPQYQEGNLTVSELFGHTRGNTGAVADRKGAFEE
jgi:transcriptional regulator with GAF, ATPase, and Fis domain